jgi:hypothetical protein
MAERIYLLIKQHPFFKGLRHGFVYGTRLQKQCEDDHDLGFELFRRIATVMVVRLDSTLQQLVNPAPPDA